jgi:hypothetical protein
MEIKFTKVMCLTSHELSKTDVELAICAKSENIVHLNIQKQIYGKPKISLDTLGPI